MDVGTAALLGAIAGALLTGGASLIVEYYRRKDDRRGIASAIAGEISAIFYVIEARQFVQYFEWLAPALVSADPPPRPWFVMDTTVETMPILKAYVGRIGSLGAHLPQRVAHFYNLYQSVITECKILCVQTDAKFGAAQINRTLPLWRQATAEGKSLIKDLQALSGVQPN